MRWRGPTVVGLVQGGFRAGGKGGGERGCWVKGRERDDRGGTFSLSRASLTGLLGRITGAEAAGGGVSAMVVESEEAGVWSAWWKSWLYAEV